MNLRHWPAVVDNVQAGWIMGFETHEIGILANAGVLHVLADASGTQRKRFATSYLLRLAEDCKAMDKLRATLIRFWADKNASRHNDSPPPAN